MKCARQPFRLNANQQNNFRLWNCWFQQAVRLHSHARNQAVVFEKAEKWRLIDTWHRADWNLVLQARHSQRVEERLESIVDVAALADYAPRGLGAKHCDREASQSVESLTYQGCEDEGA